MDGAEGYKAEDRTSNDEIAGAMQARAEVGLKKPEAVEAEGGRAILGSGGQAGETS